MTAIFKREQKQAGLDARTERLICTGMVVSAQVLRDLSQIYRPELMCADFTRWVADQCVAFHEQHGAAPGRHVEDLLHSAKRNGMNAQLADLASEFLSGISSEYERTDKFNEGYVVKQAESYFKARSLRIAAEDTMAFLEAGKTEEAETAWAEYKRVGRTGPEGVNPFSDTELIRAAFTQVERPLFTLPGIAGNLVNRQLVRTGFLGLMGQVKSGKSFTLMEFAKYAAKARCNVALIGIGDMSREDYALRYAVNLAGRSNDREDCGAAWVTCVDCLLNQNGTCKNPARVSKVGLPNELVVAETPHPDDAPKEYRPCSACAGTSMHVGASWWRWRKAVEPLQWGEALRLGKRFMRRLKGRDFKLEVFPSGGITPNGLDGLLARWRDYEEFIADVVVVDYLDLMASDTKFDQFRHQENSKWQGMRGLAQKWNNLVISATQSDADSYTKESLGLQNFSEDRRKYDHVTGMLGLHKTEAERRRGLARWSWLVLRRGHFGVSDQVVVAQSLSQGRPLVGSWWRR